MADETCKSSGSIPVTAAQVVSNRPCKLSGISITPAAAISTITLYDNSSAAAGTIVGQMSVPASAATLSLNIETPIECLAGCTAVVTGTGATAIVYYALI